MMSLLLPWGIMGLAMVGTFLNVVKLRACFVVWIGTNGAWAAHNYLRGDWAQMAFFIFNTGMCVWGYRAWGRVAHD